MPGREAGREFAALRDRADAGQGRSPSRRVVVWIGVGVTGICLFLAVRDVSLADVWRALRTSNPWWIPLSVTLLAVTVLIRSYRWTLLFSRETRPRFRDAAAAAGVGYFFNSILPLRAGEAARTLALSGRTGVARSEVATTVVVERLYDVLALLFLLFVTVPWLPHVGWLRAAAILGAGIVAGCVVAVLVLSRFGDRPLVAALRPLGALRAFPPARRAGLAAGVARGLASLRRPRMGLQVMLWTLVSWLTLAFSYGALLPSFGIAHAPLTALLVTIAINLGMILPSLPAGLGVFEGAVVVALGAYGISGADALSYALVLHAVNFFPYLALGPLFIAEPRAVFSSFR